MGEQQPLRCDEKVRFLLLTNELAPSLQKRKTNEENSTGIAQLVERRPFKANVKGSSPFIGITLFYSAYLIYYIYN